MYGPANLQKLREILAQKITQGRKMATLKTWHDQILHEYLNICQRHRFLMLYKTTVRIVSKHVVNNRIKTKHNS